MAFEMEDNYFMSRKSAPICATAAKSSADFSSDICCVEMSTGGAAAAAGGGGDGGGGGGGGVSATIQCGTQNHHHTCPICTKSFSSTSTLNRHWREFHSDRPKESDGNPGVSFEEDSTKILRYDALGLSVCDSATMTPTTSSSFAESINQMRAGGQLGQLAGLSVAHSNRQCSVCLKIFSSSSCMNRHRRDFHGDRSREKVMSDTNSTLHANGIINAAFSCNRQQCLVCLKTFSSPSTLYRHQREIHGDKKSFKVKKEKDPEAEAIAAAISRVKSDRSGEKNFRCSECHRSLSSRSSYFRHLATNHPHIKLEQQDLMFSSDAAFHVWKAKMELESQSNFIKNGTVLNKAGGSGGNQSEATEADVEVTYYNCSRNYEQYFAGANNLPMKMSKYFQSPLMQPPPLPPLPPTLPPPIPSAVASIMDPGGVLFFCPAHIVTRKSLCNNLVATTFVFTHVHGQSEQPDMPFVSQPPSSQNYPRNYGLPERAHRSRPACPRTPHHRPAEHEVKHEPVDKYRARKERLFDELNQLFPLIDECAADNEFDAFDGLIKLVRPILMAIRSPTTVSTATTTTTTSSADQAPSENFHANFNSDSGVAAAKLTKEFLRSLCPLIGLEPSTFDRPCTPMELSKDGEDEDDDQDDDEDDDDHDGAAAVSKQAEKVQPRQSQLDQQRGGEQKLAGDRPDGGVETHDKIGFL